jgi:cobalt/nickel transport protein
MKKSDRNLIIGAVIICLIIGILAPFLASSNPDGLEKSAEQLSTTEESGVVQVPFADYTIPGLGKIGEIGAMFIGIIVTLIVAFFVAMLIARRKTPPETSK